MLELLRSPALAPRDPGGTTHHLSRVEPGHAACHTNRLGQMTGSDAVGGSIVDLLVAAARDDRGLRVIRSDGADDYTSWRDILARSRRVASVLVERGIRPGDAVGIIGRTSLDLVTVLQAAWLTGAHVVMLPLPSRGSLAAFSAHVRRIVERARLSLVVTDGDLAPLLNFDTPTLSVAVANSGDDDHHQLRLPIPGGSDICLLQFTSGSTASPRGVVLRHKQVTTNVCGIVQAARITDDDSFLSWMPLFHDMGLIGFLVVPMCIGVDATLIPTDLFVNRPHTWMRVCSEYRVTLTGGPNFSFGLAARYMQRTTERLDLSALRLVFNGGEPIDPASVSGFVEAGRPHGLTSTTPYSVYGLAEASLAVTFPEPGLGLQTDRISRRSLAEGLTVRPADDRSDACELAILGKAIPGVEFRITCGGTSVSERTIGNIEIRGDSVMDRYVAGTGAPDRARCSNEWLDTGDIGYVTEDGQLVVCGRSKDLIIMGGRNVWPQDVETAVTGVDDVRPGNAIAFSVPERGTESLVVVAEVHRSRPTSETVPEICEAVRQLCGVAPRYVTLIDAGQLPKTSSGKLQRGACRKQWLSGAYL